MEKIYAAEENFLLSYLSKIENATAEERKAAEDMFSIKDLPEILEIKDNTAHISIVGPLSRKGPTALDMYFGYGGASYSQIIQVVEHAEENPAVEKIIFHMDTPGGEVTGVDQCAGVIAGCKKHTLALNHGMIASAGVWLAAGCDRIEAFEATSETGSIGVVLISVDTSKMMEDYGIKVIEIVSTNAPDKRPDADTARGRAALQEQVDALENVFMTRVATGRGTTLKDVRENYGRGSLLIAENPDGNDAVKIGLIDGLYPGAFNPDNMDSTATAQANADENNSEAYVSETTPEGGTTEETMDFNEFLAQNPDARARYDADISAAENRGVETGKSQVQAVVAKVTPFIGNADYPGIDALAKKVLSGEEDVSALTGAVTAFDMLKGQDKSSEAKKETTAAGETPAEQTEATTETGDVKTEADYQAEVNRSKAALGVK